MSTPSRRPDRNLAMELVRVTESAALAASRWVGRGDKNGADGAAVAAMRTVLSTVTITAGPVSFAFVASAPKAIALAQMRWLTPSDSVRRKPKPLRRTG